MSSVMDQVSFNRILTALDIGGRTLKDIRPVLDARLPPIIDGPGPSGCSQVPFTIAPFAALAFLGSWNGGCPHLMYHISPASAPNSPNSPFLPLNNPFIPASRQPEGAYRDAYSPVLAAYFHLQGGKIETSSE